MKAELEDWKNGWHGVSLGLKQSELEQLIQLLQDLKKRPRAALSSEQPLPR